MIEHPCAKINLGLNIVSKREDGYHNLETVFYPVGICDELNIEVRNDGNANTPPCTIEIEGINIDGAPEDNLVVRAYMSLKEIYPDLPPVSVRLKKNIPTQAGMGGGSADCAYTITTLNKMFKLGLSIPDMQTLAARLGADCAFFINPAPAFATGIGEKLTPVNVDLSGYTIAIVKPPLKISTKEAFAEITPQQPAKCCRDIIRQPVSTWKDELVNDFETSIIKRHGEIAEIKRKLYDMGAVYASMSGSGSAMFGLFEDKPANIGKVFNNYFTYIL